MKHLPIEIVYEEYNNGATTIELSEKYNCSVTTIRKRLIKYCKQLKIAELVNYLIL